MQGLFQGLWTGVGCGLAGILGTLAEQQGMPVLQTLPAASHGFPPAKQPLLLHSSCHAPSPAGGVLYGSHGAEFLFRLSGLAILGCTAATAVPALLLRRRRKRRARESLPSKESMDDLAALAQH